MPESKDLVIAIMGASGAMAGLLLIFSGFLFGEAASLPKDETADAILDKLRRSARIAMVPFCGFLITTIVSTCWLIQRGHFLFWLNAGGFLLLVVVTGVYGVWASYR